MLLLALAAGAAVALRFWLYTRHYPLGIDEQMLAVNLRDGRFSQLFGTLPYYDQAAPLLYLLCTKVFYAVAGY